MVDLIDGNWNGDFKDSDTGYEWEILIEGDELRWSFLNLEHGLKNLPRGLALSLAWHGLFFWRWGTRCTR